MKHHTILTLLLVGAIAAFAGFSLKQNLPPAQTTNPVVGQCRPDYALRDLLGHPVSGDNWDGKVVLLNFWAAWCPPCRREIPAFSEVREFYRDDGFEVVGIAIDDLDSVKTFLSGMKTVRYAQLIGDYDATALMRDLGNQGGGLPYSVLLDRNGTVRFAKSGELKKTMLINQLEPLLNEEASAPCRS